MTKHQYLHYIVYKITNLATESNSYGRIYIGVHRTNNLDDGYFGSSKLLNLAVLKYGKENFKYEILHFCNSSEEMYLKEKELVDENFILREDTYNMKTGGYIGNTRYSPEAVSNRVKSRNGYKPTRETRQKISDAHKGKKLSKECREKMSKTRTGKKHSEETKEKMRLAAIKHGPVKRAMLLGTKASEETKEKMRLAAKAVWAKRKQKKEVNS